MNLILLTDSYKLTHWNQYPPNTEYIHSYLSSRYGEYNGSVFFGLQYILKKYFTKPITQLDINEAYEISKKHFGCENAFNLKGWQYILDHHKGYLPIVISAREEGSLVEINKPILTIQNTDPKCFWLTNYVESILLQLWYPITIATLSLEIRQIIEKYIRLTGSGDYDFKLHNFGLRGSSSIESAAIGGAAHLTSFSGTDDLPAIKFIQDYYNLSDVAAFSIPATEHSTMTSWGRNNEADAYRNMLNNYKDSNSIKAFSVVSDSYDIENACSEIWGNKLLKEVENSKATLVIRPDSGEPVHGILNLLRILSGKFGISKNEKGYKILNKVRLIQGDGINRNTLVEILSNMAEYGWSCDNIVFGMGGGLMQKMDRDSLGFAIKCNMAVVNGDFREVYKRPVGDPLKASHRGLFSKGLLNDVFINGKLVLETDFNKIKEKIKSHQDNLISTRSF